MLNRDSIMSCIWKILSANLVQQVHEYTVGGAVMLSVFTGQKNELLLYRIRKAKRIVADTPISD